MQIAFAPVAWRAWRKLPTQVQDRLQRKLAEYASDPLQYAIKLIDPAVGTYRFRIGDYRIVFDLADDEMVILAVGHRKEIYR